MPRIAIDYSKTIIYRIVCKDVNIKDCYVGSTTDFKSRKTAHKTKCSNNKNKEYNYNVYVCIRENGNWDNWDMIQIECYNAINKLDAHKRERHWLEYYCATLNMCIPSRTDKEYRDDTKETSKEYFKKYNEEHKDERLKYITKYTKENKEKITEYNKKYNKEHKDKIQERRSKFSKEYINRQAREIYHRKKERNLMCLEDKV